jgi:hypothetical protein
MTYSAPEDVGRLSNVHSLALRTEIGERLRTTLAPRSAALPPSLRTLMTRMRDEPPVLET